MLSNGKPKKPTLKSFRVNDQIGGWIQVELPVYSIKGKPWVYASDMSEAEKKHHLECLKIIRGFNKNASSDTKKLVEIGMNMELFEKPKKAKK